MKILSLKNIGRYCPQSSGGTGYSEPDMFEVTVKDGDETFKKTVYIDIWYCTFDLFKERFITDIHRSFKDEIENIDEAFEMWAKETIVGLATYERNKDRFKEMYGFVA